MKNALKVFIGLIPVALLSTTIFANELDSTNYKLIGVSTTGGGGVVESTNYELLSSVGQISADPRNYSTNYRINQDPSAIFTAAQPSVQCFETDTDGTTNCTSGPAELLSGGMVAICGAGGCYDKARFEIGTHTTALSTTSSVGFWNLDQSSGSGAYLLDSSSNAYHGTPTGTSYTTGVFDGARSFNGTSDYVSIGTLGTLGSSMGSTPTTISFWIKTTDTANIRQFGTLNIGVNTLLVINFNRDESDAYSANKIGLNIRDESARNLRGVADVTEMYDGNWHYVTISGNISTKEIKVHLDGVLKSTTYGAQDTLSGFANFQYPFTFGAANSRGTIVSHMNATVDNFAINTGTFTTAEIVQQYNSGLRNKVNPDDTLYTVQISTDNFVSDIQCIDASTFRPKTIANCDINDFRTESYWETEDFNVQGLTPDTQYYIRISALHGDFTQSDFSSTASATTTAGTMLFDIDIDDAGGYTTETSSPYSILFAGTDELVAGAAATTATDLIWLDVVSSSSGGVAVIQFGTNGGLYSATTTETIPSDNEDLDVTGAEGFGLQSYYIDYEVSGYLGEITSTTNYSGSINTVGAVSTTANKIYDGDGPINDGRLGIYVKARAGVGRTASTDYEEEIHFILVPRY